MLEFPHMNQAISFRFFSNISHELQQNIFLKFLKKKKNPIIASLIRHLRIKFTFHVIMSMYFQLTHTPVGTVVYWEACKTGLYSSMYWVSHMQCELLLSRISWNLYLSSQQTQGRDPRYLCTLYICLERNFTWHVYNFHR